MKITTPDEMRADLTKLEEAINKFELKFQKEEKGKHYYRLIISGKYNREVCDKIEEMYREAGWDEVRCTEKLVGMRLDVRSLLKMGNVVV